MEDYFIEVVLAAFAQNLEAESVQKLLNYQNIKTK